MISRVKRAGWVVPVVVGIALLGAGLGVYWEALRTLHRSAEGVAAEAEIQFTATNLDRVPPPGYESISAPAVFRDAAVFEGRLYLSGPGGLFAYEPNGALKTRYRVGLELPPAPIVSLAKGVLADSGEPELFAATAGEGLLAFNGRGFRNIRPQEASYRDLTALLPLATGRILLGTRKKGVLVYDGKRIAPFHPQLSGVHVTALAADDQGGEAGVWVGTLDQGVWHWHGGQVDRFGEAEGMPDAQILSLAVAGDAAYAGTALGVAEFRGGRFTRTLASGFFARTLLVRGETLLVGTLEEGTVEIPLATRPAHEPRPKGRPFPTQVERLLEIQGSVYALAENGLYVWEGGGRAVIEREAASLTDGNISALAVDAAGRLWVGYFDRGLDILDGGHATHFEDEHVFCVNRIVHDPDRNLTAVATANGLVMFDSSRPRQVLGRAEGLIADHVTDVVIRGGATTVATPAGITFLDGAGTRSMYAFHGLVNNHVYALGASGNRLLVGTLGGISVLDAEVIRASYTTANSSLKHNWITAIAPVGMVGEEWFVGTYGAGVLRLDAAGRWQSFHQEAVVNPNAMAVTGTRVYAGTLGGGLYIYERATERWRTVFAGLPSANVTAVTADRGWIYVGTDNGLVRFPE